jgi:hypothetical protein
MSEITLEFIRKTILEIDPSLESCAAFNTALVLLSAVTLGPYTARLSLFTRLPVSFIETIRQRMMSAELWTEEEVCCDHWYPSDQAFYTTAFFVDVLVAEGLVIRQWHEEQGDYLYCAPAYAPGDREPKTVN